MRAKLADLTVGRAAGLLASVILAGAVTACAGSAGSTTSASSVSCTNFAIHGSGKYHYEVWVRVSVRNVSSKPVNDVVDVALTGADPGGTGTPSTHVMITGLVTANSSTELSRKVLTGSQVEHCQISRLSQS